LKAVDPQTDTDQPADREARVTSLELFFDLVFVYAMTQVTAFLYSHPTWSGLFRGGLLLSVLWWAWSGYAWLTNALDPEEDAVRIGMLAAVAAMLIVSLAVPGAFGPGATTFAVGYMVLRGLQLVLFVRAGRGDRDLLHAVQRVVPPALVSAILLLIAGFVPDRAQLALWVAAAVINYLGAAFGHLHGWRVSPDHFVERFSQIILIALGESVVAIGIGARGLPVDASLIGAALLGITVIACLWWSYFDWMVYAVQSRLSQATGDARALLARDAYSYLHLPMVGGVVLFAFGLRTVLSDETRSLPTIPAFALVDGIALYLLAHVAVRLRLGAGLGRGRPIASALLLALFPAVREIPGVAALGLVAAVCVSLIAYEALRHREARAVFRAQRGAVRTDEVEQAEASHVSRRRPHGG
jgi:low temperature requirement protein LtrA